MKSRSRFKFSYNSVIYDLCLKDEIHDSSNVRMCVFVCGEAYIAFSVKNTLYTRIVNLKILFLLLNIYLNYNLSSCN